MIGITWDETIIDQQRAEIERLRDILNQLLTLLERGAGSDSPEYASGLNLCSANESTPLPFVGPVESDHAPSDLSKCGA